MRFYTFVATAATLLATFASAQLPLAISAPGSGAVLQAGQTTTITWLVDTDAEVVLTLRSGAANHLDPGTPIATVANSGKYAWTVPMGVVDGTSYTIEIADGSGGPNMNYSPYFSITGGTGVSSVASSAAASSVAAPSASSAALSTASSAGSSPTSAMSVTEAATLTTETTKTLATKSSKTSASPTASASSTNNGVSVRSGSLAAVVGMGALVMLA